MPGFQKSLFSLLSTFGRHPSSSGFLQVQKMPMVVSFIVASALIAQCQCLKNDSKRLLLQKKRPRLKSLSLMVGPWEFSRFSEKGFWILKKSCWEFGIFSYFAIWKLCYPERWTFNFCTKVENQFIFFYEVIH